MKDKIISEKVITGTRVSVRETPSYVEKNWFQPLSKKKTGYINSGNILFGKSTFILVGGFDEHLETGEDVDICTRAKRLGVSILPNGGFKVYHDAFPTSLRQFIRREIWHGKGDYKNLSKFMGSKVAIMASFVALLHYAVLFCLFYRQYDIVLYLLTGIFIIVFAVSINIFQKLSSLSQSIKNIPITYLYIISRHLSVYSILRKFLSI